MVRPLGLAALQPDAGQQFAGTGTIRALAPEARAKEHIAGEIQPGQEQIALRHIGDPADDGLAIAGPDRTIELPPRRQIGDHAASRRLAHAGGATQASTRDASNTKLPQAE